MYNFKQIGGVHHDLPDFIGPLMLSTAGLMLVTCVCLYIYSTQLPEKRKKEHIDTINRLAGIATLVGFFGLLITGMNAISGKKTYEGVFKITESNATFIDTTNEDNRTITIQDKDGTKQRIRVDAEDGNFQKGHNVFIRVTTTGSNEKPALTKPLDTVNIDKIKQIN